MILENSKVTSITPVIVNPETTFIILNTSFQYDSNVTTKTQSDLETLINTTISNYNSDNLQDFNKPFRHSQLTGLIDDTDDLILSNVTTVTLAKFVTPDTQKQLHTLSFDNAFFHPHDGHNSVVNGIIASTGFFIDGNTTREYFFDDDGNGNLQNLLSCCLV